ncbi:P2Y purinoceptor 13 [Phyllobates terribilis]|uniref:P2Y purinoceptor 13 n=1 Tax=Phyllobates terribilis TaxID=111132 RepID=UPI003CCB26DB
MNPETLNTTNGSSSVKCSRDVTTTQIVFPILYTILFFLGIIMNCLSAWIFFQVPSKSVFIVYLKNTMVADIIMTLMLPFKILTDASMGPWQMKAFVCRFSAVIFYETMYINIILLGLIGLDRFLKIVRPFGQNFMDSVSQAKKISAAVWIVIFSLSLPNMILSSQKATPENIRSCTLLKTPLGVKWHEAVNYICMIIFWLVFISMTLFYTIISKKVYDSYMKSKSKDKASRKKTRFKVFIVVAVFFLCFAPFHFLRLPYTFSQVGIIKDCQLQNMLYVAKESSLWIAATNVLMDPLIYVMLCKPFRKMIPGLYSSTSTNLETTIKESSNLKMYTRE